MGYCCDEPKGQTGGDSVTEKSVVAQVECSWDLSKKLEPSFDEMRLIGPTTEGPCSTFFFTLSPDVYVRVSSGEGGWMSSSR